MSFLANANPLEHKVLLEQIKKIVPDEKDSFGADTSEYSIEGINPLAVVFPSTTQQIAAILQLAHDNNLVVVPAGGMTKQTIGNRAAHIDILLSTAKLRGLKYDASQSTITAGAGITIAELHAAVADSPHFLPLNPLLANRATVGGVLATAGDGPLRSGHGAVEDLCTRLDFVSAEGTIVTASRHFRRLMIGSFGTLGVIASATFRLSLKPECTCTLGAEFTSLEDAMRGRDQVMAAGVQPMSLEIVSPRAQEYLLHDRPARDPDVYAPLAPVKAVPWKLLVRVGGEKDHMERCRRALENFLPAEFHLGDEQLLWQRIADWEAAVVARHRNATIFHVSVRVSEVLGALVAAEQTAEEHNLLFAAIGRIAVGAMVVAFLPMGVDPVSAMQCAIATSAFRGRLREDATAVVVRCPPEAKDYFNVWGSTPTDMQVMRAIRETFDPKGILNRGRFMV